VVIVFTFWLYRGTSIPWKEDWVGCAFVDLGWIWRLGGETNYLLFDSSDIISGALNLPWFMLRVLCID
jgi:hypothetical protein